jgi:hypothetical protein
MHMSHKKSPLAFQLGGFWVWRKLWLRLSMYGFRQVCTGIDQPRVAKYPPQTEIPNAS